MLLTIPDLLDAATLAAFRQALAQATWVDGRGTAGHAALKAKDNQQLAHDDPLSRELGARVLEALHASTAFRSATLPLRVLPPRFNRYAGGAQYGFHVDNAVMSVPETGAWIRTDLSSTLFLSDPGDYDGGELVVQDASGTHAFKLPAGHLLVYPGSSLHRVLPVTRGVRVASFFWTQSLVRDDARRQLLHELEQAIQSLAAREPGAPELARLAHCRQDLLRQWADA